MASCSHHGSVLCQNPTTKQIVTYILRFVHIKLLPNETNHTGMPHGISQEKLRIRDSIDSHMRDH